MELRRCYSFYRNCYVWMLYNEHGDAIARLATDLNAEQIDFFKSTVWRRMPSPHLPFSLLSDTLVRCA